MLIFVSDDIVVIAKLFRTSAVSVYFAQCSSRSTYLWDELTT